MGFQTYIVTPDRFEDFADVINESRRPNHCWCLSHRLTAAEVRELGGDNSDSRATAMRRLCERRFPPGVVTYLDGEPVGWANVGPRAEITKLARSRLIRPVDGVPVWSIVCVIVRPGHRGQGVSRHLIEGAIRCATDSGAPAIEAYPADPDGRMDQTMAFVGTRSMFERSGFEVIGQTAAKSGGLARLIMRRNLTSDRTSAELRRSPA